MRRIILAAVLFFLPLSQALAAHETLTVGLNQFPSTLHPNIDSMLAKSWIEGATRRDLTVYDADWKLICQLCTELPSFENGRALVEEHEDGTRTLASTYTIRPEAVWGDGEPVTTEDVLFTWRAMKDEEAGASNLELFKNDIADITALDEKSFTVHFDKLTCDVAGLNDFHILPAHLEEAVFKEGAADYRRRTLYDRAPDTPGLWNGPYLVTEVSQGSHVILERNPHWWGRRPHFDRITVKIIENSAGLPANLLSGDIDYIAGELGVTLDQGLAFQRGHGADWNIVFKEGLQYEHIDFNLDNPVLADVRVRRALLMGVDRASLSRSLFEGRQPVADGSISPLDAVYNSDVAAYEFDPSAAGALLDEAGWRLRGGKRVNASGETLSLSLVTTAGNAVREQVQAYLIAQWRRLGVEVRADNQPPRVMFAETLDHRLFPAMAMYAWYASPENIPRSTLHSGEIPSEANGWSGQNYPGYDNPEMDRALEDMETVCEAAPRQALWNRVQELYVDELPAMPLYWRADAYIMPKWLTGIRPTGHMYPSTLWIEEWGVAE
jgi:peptide/nickel transport system substrate-binding protein